MLSYEQVIRHDLPAIDLVTPVFLLASSSTLTQDLCDIKSIWLMSVFTNQVQENGVRPLTEVIETTGLAVLVLHCNHISHHGSSILDLRHYNRASLLLMSAQMYSHQNDTASTFASTTVAERVLCGQNRPHAVLWGDIHTFQ